VAERAEGEDRREGEICWRWTVWQEHRDFEGGEEEGMGDICEGEGKSCCHPSR
jgi:hypothetical protein